MWLLLFPVASFALGLVTGRWWAAVAAIGVWAGLALFLVFNDGWYGHGWGDGGILLNVIVAAVTVLAAAAGVAARSLGNRIAAK